MSWRGRRLRPGLPASVLVALLLGAGAVQADDEPAGRAEEGTTADDEIEALIGPTGEETIVVTASRTAESLLDAPVAVSVVGEETIRTTAADNVVDLLRAVPGLNVIQTSARDFNLTPRAATGVLSQGQLALVDGRPINEPNNGNILWDQVPLFFDELERVEVQRGPGSAVWGANALFGVVHLRTKPARELAGGLFEVAAGEQGTREARFRWAEARENHAWKLSLGWAEQDGWPRPTTLPDGTPIPPGFDAPPQGTEQPRLDFRVDWDSDPERVWSLRLGYAGSTGLVVTRSVPLRFDDGSYSGFVDVTRTSDDFDFRVSWNRVHSDAVNLADGSKSLSENDALLVDATWRRRFGLRHRAVYGASISPAFFDVESIPNESSRMELGAYFEDQWTVSNRVLLHLGARVDHFETFGVAVSPRVSLVVRPKNEHSFRVSYGRAYRSPTLVENFLEFTSLNAIDLGLPDLYVFPTVVLGDPDLDEVRSETFELGWTSVVADHVVSAALYRTLARDNVQFYASSFYTPDNPPPDWPLDPALLADLPLIESFSYRNVARVETQGFELSVESRWSDHVRTAFTYAWQDEPRVTDQAPNQPLVVNEPAEHQLGARVTYLAERFRGSLSLSWVDSAFFADVLDPRFWGETDAQLFVDVSGTWSWADGAWELALGATNALDDEIQQHPYGDVIGRRATATLRARF